MMCDIDIKSPWELRKWDGESWPDKRYSVGNCDGESVCISPRYADDEENEKYLSFIANAPSVIQQLEQDKAEIEAKYQELVMAVESKFMGESRHATALRYIKEAEAYKSESAGIARMEK